MRSSTEREGVRTEREGFSRALGRLLVVVIFGLAIGTPIASGQSSGDRYIGTWAGMWDGAGSGDFELTLDQAKDGPLDGPLEGRVVVATDGGNYNANLKRISFDGPKMTARYDFPLDSSAEIFVTATFEDKSAKGTWAMRPKGQEGDIAAGTFTVSKK